MSSMKKFLLSSLVCTCAFLFLFGSTACVTINYINSESSTSQESSSSNSSSQSSSNSSSTSQDSSSSGSSSQSSSNSSSTSQDSSSSNSSSQDSTDDNSGNTGNKPEPTPLDANDLADTKYAYTKIINDWVVHSTLTQQSSFASEDSNYALKGSFNYKDGDPYTANGANEIWTTPCFDLEEYYGSAQNLQGKAVSFDVKLENTSSAAAFSIMRTDNIRQTEHSLDLKPYASSSSVSIVKETLNDEWVRFTVNLDLLFSANLLTDVKYIVLVFSNVGCKEEIDSVYYVDNMSIGTAAPLEWYTDSYNPDGYYSKNESLTVRFVGDISTYDSDTAGWLQTIANLNNAYLTADHIYTISSNHYEQAFGSYGYMNKYYKPDVLYLQGFYNFNDAYALNNFAKKLTEFSPDTELKIFTAENETTDGLTAGENMGLDAVNGRALIKDLKTKGFTAENLNCFDGDPNELSGIIGAVLIYMDLYGEAPDMDSLFAKMKNYGSTNYLPGTTSQEKYDSLSLIFSLITNDDSGNTGNEPEPTPLDANDLADTKYAYTKIINDWVVHSTLTQQSSFASEDSNYALKGSFNYKSGTPYTANGANEIWTTPCFDLEEYYGSAQNLQGKSVSFDVKIENTAYHAAFSIMRTDGIRQTEHSLDCLPHTPLFSASIVKETLNDEWVRFTVNLDLLFSANLLTDVKYIVLVFSNVGCNEEIDSVYYVDNMSIETAAPFEWYTNSYNPDKYYSKNEPLTVHLAGNSFIYYSNTAGWLETIATLNNANLTASFTWVPNGRIPNQYEEAFSLYGYLNENYQPNLLYIQDFYDLNDAFALNFFAEKLMEISPDTELKIYTAENETTDGLLAGENMGLDVVNWRALIKDLKTRGFTTDHLNDARDGWHPNELSGVIGAILIYMDLYGEIPNIDTLFDKMQITSDNFYSTTLTNYLPGTTSQEKYNSLSLIFTLAAEYANL